MTGTTDPSVGALLVARELGKSYTRSRGFFRKPERLHAFSSIDLRLEPGRVVGLVGASGAGKSSLARCLSLLERPDDGSLSYRGRDLSELSGSELRAARRELQLVFQDSAGSFNPGWTAREALEEPLRLASGLDSPARRDRVEEVAAQVGLLSTDLDRRARDFSGGQLKRLNLARALSVEPSVLILDEPFSGLDVSLKAQIANLLESLLERQRPACLHISHDLTMVSHLADEIVVLDRGRIVERGSVADILTKPAARPTRQLIAAGSLVSP